jgi:uncharacterized protein (UPF0332 family)
MKKNLRVNLGKEFVAELNRLRNEEPEEWEKRWRISTKRLLSSMFFLVSARNVYHNGNKLLPAIGYYYSLFHLSKALLFLLPKYSREQLKGIPHREVLRFIKADFVQTEILPEAFTEIFEYTKDVREAANYGQDTWIGLSKLLEENEPRIMECIGYGIQVLKEICNKEMLSVQSLIGDGIGDDWRDSYLSEEESEMLTRILLDYNLTT